MLRVCIMKTTHKEKEIHLFIMPLFIKGNKNTVPCKGINKLESEPLLQGCERETK